MKCPFCHFEGLKVTDSRDAPEMNAVKRRRECLSCLKRFTTFETVELTVQVKKAIPSFRKIIVLWNIKTVGGNYQRIESWNLRVIIA